MDCNKISIAPLSVNKAWQGRKIKTQKYRQYERDLLRILPKCAIPDGKLSIVFSFGVSSKSADIDNPVKPLLDILQSAYGFNDRMVYEMRVKKIDVKKGDEFVEFLITSYNQSV